MAGGLLNLVAEGNQNVFLTGNPKKTFFKATYTKYSNFGLQKFRIDFEGSKFIDLTSKTHFTFKIPRYADLLMDSYLVLKLPTIWSPLYRDETLDNPYTVPYEFKWIENLGAQIIDELTITCGNYTLQKVDGQYMTAQVQRDFSDTKKRLYDEMTGNTAEFNDPARYVMATGDGADGVPRPRYPSAWTNSANTSPSGIPIPSQPSIVGKNLYIPLNMWFNLNSKMAFPLVSLQYNELHFNVSLRPVREWFTIKNVNYGPLQTAETTKEIENIPHVQPNFNVPEEQFYVFLQAPPPTAQATGYITTEMIQSNIAYPVQRTSWNSDIHLISTFAFLSDDERRQFAQQQQKYLLKQVYRYAFNNLFDTKKVKLDSLGMVADYMWFFRRSDANTRNAWSNYTNWDYNKINPVSQIVEQGYYFDESTTPTTYVETEVPGAGGFATTGPYHARFVKNIMLSFGVLLNGKYREKMLEAGVYNYTEKYTRTPGNAPDGLYCYNFCLDTDPLLTQPNGAMNLSKFRNIEFEFVTITPPLNENAQVYEICDADSGEVIGVNKFGEGIYKYTFDLFVYEERYNILEFTGGNCGLMYAR